MILKKQLEPRNSSTDNFYCNNQYTVKKEQKTLVHQHCNNHPFAYQLPFSQEQIATLLSHKNCNNLKVKTIPRWKTIFSADLTSDNSVTVHSTHSDRMPELTQKCA